jgi:hypothetical protein
MTKSEIVTEILDRLELTGTAATARVGRSVNRHHRKVTADLGLQVTRRGTVTANTVIATNTITFTGIEKIEFLIDDSAGEYRILKETTYDELRRVVAPAEADPGAWAVMNQGATTVKARLDVTCTDVRALTADGLIVVTDLGDNDEPSFSESFHDYLIERVLQDEYLKQEKPELSVLARDEAAKILSALRFHIAKSSHLKLRQRGSNQLNDSTSLPRSGGGGRGDVLGPGSATDNAVVRFDSTTGKLIQDSAVTIDDTGIIVTPAQIQSTLATGTAPLQVASTTVVANLNADLLDGLEATAFLQPDGSVPLTADWDAGAFEIRAETFESDVATGTAPLVIASTTLVSNLNADLLDGIEAAEFVQRDGSIPMTGDLDMGTQAITNVGNVDGVDVSQLSTDFADHSARHEAAGADPLFDQDLNAADTPSFAGLGLTGELTAADQVVSRPELKDYAETVVAVSVVSNAATVDMEDGNVFELDLDDDLTTLTISNPPATGKAGSFTLIVTSTGTNTITWPESVQWPGGTEPTITGDGVDVLGFLTVDGGTTWLGMVGGLDFQ